MPGGVHETRYDQEKYGACDFDKALSPNVKEAVYATETFQRFLFARKRVEHMAEALFVSGGRFNDKALLGAARELNALAAELQAVIERRKRGSG